MPRSSFRGKSIQFVRMFGLMLAAFVLVVAAAGASFGQLNPATPEAPTASGSQGDASDPAGQQGASPPDGTNPSDPDSQAQQPGTEPAQPEPPDAGTPSTGQVDGPNSPADMSGNRIEVVINTASSKAEIRLIESGAEVRSISAFAGAADSPTPPGEYTVTAHLGTIHTTLYSKSLGHEFCLHHFLQFKGNYGFHAFKINDATDEQETGPTHGCIAMEEEDAEMLYEWAEDGTTVTIRTMD